MTQNDLAFAMEGPAFAQLERLGPIDWTGGRRGRERLARDLAGAADLTAADPPSVLARAVFLRGAGAARPRAGPASSAFRRRRARARRRWSRTCWRSCRSSDFAAHGRVDRRLLSHARGAAERGGRASRQPVPRTPRLSGHARRRSRREDARRVAGAWDTTRRRLEHVRVPVYDKSAHGGRGDRAPESDVARRRRTDRPRLRRRLDARLFAGAGIDARAIRASSRRIARSRPTTAGTACSTPSSSFARRIRTSCCAGGSRPKTRCAPAAGRRSTARRSRTTSGAFCPRTRPTAARRRTSRPERQMTMWLDERRRVTKAP